MHRFVWDLRYTAPSVPQHGYSMATVFGQNVPSEPEGPQALPGSYTLRLSVDGKSYTQPLKLIMDPRVTASPRDLEKQFALETRISQALGQANQALAEIHDFYARNKENGGAAEKLKALAEIESPPGQHDHRSSPDISGLSGTLAQLLTAVDSADTAPTAAENEAAEKTLSQLQPLLHKWDGLKK